MIKDKNQKGVEKETQGEEEEQSELQKSFDLEVIMCVVQFRPFCQV